MRRKLLIRHECFEIEQCGAENVRIYRVRGLRLFDEPDEKNDGPVIDLVRSLHGVEQATFEDCHTFVIRRSPRMTWQETEPQIVNLLQGVAACSDSFRPRLEVNADFAEEQLAEVKVAILRSAQRRAM